MAIFDICNGSLVYDANMVNLALGEGARRVAFHTTKIFLKIFFREFLIIYWFLYLHVIMSGSVLNGIEKTAPV